MSKKQKELEAQVNTAEEVKKDQISEGVALKEDKKKEKQVKDKKKEKKKKEGSKIVKKTKETVSELKKVTWPSFGEVVKKTGVVIAFVLIFGLFLFGVNTLLGWLVGLLV